MGKRAENLVLGEVDQVQDRLGWPGISQQGSFASCLSAQKPPTIPEADGRSYRHMTDEHRSTKEDDSNERP
ncbi:hypothetical protein IE53DRAFT_377700 [Violaceomyces palustris]|uniref:Uncharacterized protein n=1 Tax=Violaceomyces palustris TaxID=1673888 RepID=A0ACD0P4T1_9BASI|nr:hypothetical protein IE53DRAFT_377700 [Violaceomyces palustris]